MAWRPIAQEMTAAELRSDIVLRQIGDGALIAVRRDEIEARDGARHRRDPPALRCRRANPTNRRRRFAIFGGG